MQRIYLDGNATTPPLPEVVAAMQQALSEAWANPSSVHSDGRNARRLVEDARDEVARLTSVDPRDVLFTSGGTEANNIALRSAFADDADGPRVLVTSRLEHPSVARVAEALEREGKARVHWLRIQPGGTIDLADLEEVLLEGDVRLVAVQAINGETGVIQPVERACELARERGVLVHVDAIQAWGKVEIDLTSASTVSVAAHKFRGPKGIGALCKKSEVRLHPVLLGGSQERGIRPGTLDAVLATGFGVAAAWAGGVRERASDIAVLRDRLERGLLQLRPAGVVNGAGEARAPQVVNLSFLGKKGPELVAALDLEGVSVSSGSACSAGTQEPSEVIRAMAGEENARSAVRCSLGDWTTPEEIEEALEAFARVLARG